jgi:hypothetical protein
VCVHDAIARQLQAGSVGLSQEWKTDVTTLAVEQIGDSKIKAIGDIKRYLESAPYNQQPISLQKAGRFDVPL